MINHHPSVERLSCFAAGSLPLNQALCISAHAEYCPQCRRELRRLQLVGAGIFSSISSRTNIDQLKNSLFARLDSLATDTGGAPTTTENAGRAQDSSAAALAATTTQRSASPRPSGLPLCLQSLLPEGLEAVHWKRLSPSIQAARLYTDIDGSQVELLKIKPGGQVASHNHTGEEITVVLQGSFSDSAGVYSRGDIIYRGEEHKHHRPIASQDAACICLTSVAAPIQFTGFFARLFNPLIRRSHYSS